MYIVSAIYPACISQFVLDKQFVLDQPFVLHQQFILAQPFILQSDRLADDLALYAVTISSQHSNSLVLAAQTEALIMKQLQNSFGKEI